jgi:hypothetical protein
MTVLFVVTVARTSYKKQVRIDYKDEIKVHQTSVIWNRTERNQIVFWQMLQQQSVLKTGAADSFETTATVYHIPEASNHCHRSLKPQKQTTQFDTGLPSLKYEGYSESNPQ